MKKVMLQEKYSVFTLEINENETTFKNIDGIINYLKDKIKNNKNATFISIFDHYSHTKSLEDGVIADDILDAKNLVFCFGVQLPNPLVLSVRPRSIGIVKMNNKFILSFLEAPMPQANNIMTEWIKSIKNNQ